MAKTSLSSARRGRAHVSRDYTAKLRTDAYVREAARTEQMSTIGMVGSFAAGAAQLGSAIGTKLKKWEQLESGAEQLYLEGGKDRDVKDFSFAKALGKDEAYIDKYGGDISGWDKLLKQAPVTQQLSIGDDKFYGINVAQVGALGESAGLLVDKDSDKSLYDFLKIGGDKGAKTDVVSSLETMKQARPEQTSPVVQKITAQNNTNVGNTVSSQPFRYTPSSSPSIITTTQQGHSGTGGASRVDLDTYGTVQHQTGSQSVTAFETSAPTFINQTPALPSDNLYDNYGVTNWFDSQEGGSDSSSLYDDIYGGGDFGVVPLGSVDVSRGMRNYRLK